jgi:general stress protein 26
MSEAAHPASDEDMKTIASLVRGAKIAMLTTVADDGEHHSRPLAVQEVEFGGELWFFTQDPSDKVTELRHHPRVNVAMQSNKGFLSVAGTAEVVHDSARIDEFWSPAVEAWFPGGKGDPTVALLRVRPSSAEFWVSDEPGVVTAFKVARAIFGGGTPDVGENKTVEL